MESKSELCFTIHSYIISFIYSEGGTGENRSYVTHLNFRAGPIFMLYLVIFGEKILSYSPKISKKKNLVTPLDKIRSALTVLSTRYLSPVTNHTKCLVIRSKFLAQTSWWYTTTNYFRGGVTIEFSEMRGPNKIFGLFCKINGHMGKIFCLDPSSQKILS